MHGHFKILLIQVKKLDEKKLLMEQFEETLKITKVKTGVLNLQGVNIKVCKQMILSTCGRVGLSQVVRVKYWRHQDKKEEGVTE